MEALSYILNMPRGRALFRGWSGGAMVLGKLPVPGRPTIWLMVGQGPITLAVGAVEVVLLYIWENECCMFVQMVILTRVYELTVHSALRQLVDLSG